MPDRGARGKPGQPGSGLGPDEAGLVSQDHRLHPVPQVQLGQDVPDVGLDGAFLHDEPFGDLGIRQALGKSVPLSKSLYAARIALRPIQNPVPWSQATHSCPPA
jgi:hypothetical protein